jgi:membrane protein required for beta-lactamase induction
MGKENSSSNIPFDAYLFNLALGWDSDWDPARRAGGWSVDIPDPNVNKILPSWNGTDILQLTNFGAGQLGSIARVALYGKMSAVSADSTGSAVPVPAAFWLFGTALLGFIGLPRKTGI